MWCPYASVWMPSSNATYLVRLSQLTMHFIVTIAKLFCEFLMFMGWIIHHICDILETVFIENGKLLDVGKFRRNLHFFSLT